MHGITLKDAQIDWTHSVSVYVHETAKLLQIKRKSNWKQMSIRVIPNMKSDSEPFSFTRSIA